MTVLRAAFAICLSSSLLFATACGDDGGGATSDASVNIDADPLAPDADPTLPDARSFADADPLAPDAGPNAGCTASAAECNNCVDDDGDNLIDGFDPQCTSVLDDDEETFATGIPGDNKDAVNQDCFFDGDSGGGNDGCNIHVCCLLAGDCPENLKPNQYDPNDCTPSQECIDNCGPLAPPGCDCFACCTLCNDTDGCVDVLTNPAVAPNCTLDKITDPAVCPPCNKVEECGTPCEPDGCILCPGQDPSDLPPDCNNTPTCPTGIQPCTTTADCLELQFCAQGCCINGID